MVHGNDDEMNRFYYVLDLLGHKDNGHVAIDRYETSEVIVKFPPDFIPEFFYEDGGTKYSNRSRVYLNYP